MVGCSDELLHQLQPLLQPQVSGIESFTDTVYKMDAVVAKELETVTRKMNHTQQDLKRRLKLMEERKQSTFPPRKAARSGEGGANMEPQDEGPAARPSSPSSAVHPSPSHRRASCTRSWLPASAPSGLVRGDM